MSDHPPASKTALWSWALYDWANSSFSAIIQTFVFAAYFTRQVAVNETLGSGQWGFTIGSAGIILALCSPVLGAIADQRGRRKGWIAFFTLLCVFPTALLWYVQPSSGYVPLALVLVGLGTLGAEFSFIFYNAMLPELAPPDKIGRWSGWGWGLGYIGGMLSLIACLAFFINGTTAVLPHDPENATHVRATFVLCALWYLLFALPLLLFTPKEAPGKYHLLPAIGAGLRQLKTTFLRIREYSDLVRFLIARMLYVDGLTTLFAFGGVYAAGTFNMTEQQVLLFGIALNLSAGVGALVFALLDDKLGGKRLILWSLAGLIVTCSGVLLTESLVMFWILGAAIGIFVGPAQASSRSYVARMAPANLRNEVFGFFVVSGKATSFVGPFLVGWLTYATASQRIGLASVLVFFVAGAALVATVPDDKQS